MELSYYFWYDAPYFKRGGDNESICKIEYIIRFAFSRSGRICVRRTDVIPSFIEISNPDSLLFSVMSVSIFENY